MSAAERLAAAKGRLAGITKEHGDRRALLERRVTESRKKLREQTQQRFAHAAAVAKRLHESAVRRKEAGGWDTSAATQRGGGGEFAFGPEDEEPTSDQYGGAPVGHPPARPAAEPAPAPEPRRPDVPVAGPAAPSPGAPRPGLGGPPLTSRRRRDDDEDEDYSEGGWLH
ncbi:hypothetical protein C1701_13555 [Actinoalloteichus sp. AHMU CJ021]|uniref:hypothetical protein n=1 Tax=Actinoalloteichus TaxID=65496 RepID=UPI0004AB5784|nr:hypothetical protein [Actinoalloteichus caeruleus]AUS79216.1 hypothetical protein C1701_13555 [Actinoalloteichus sp. AHMU CJ021]